MEREEASKLFCPLTKENCWTDACMFWRKTVVKDYITEAPEEIKKRIRMNAFSRPYKLKTLEDDGHCGYLDS